MREIRWQCRRGMLELDVIFERFLTHCYPTLSSDEQHAFSQLLKQDDPTLFDWLVADMPWSDPALHEIVARISVETRLCA